LNSGKSKKISFSAPIQTGSGAQPAFYTMDTGAIPENRVVEA
jgi:hypothetical protein